MAVGLRLAICLLEGRAVHAHFTKGSGAGSNNSVCTEWRLQAAKPAEFKHAARSEEGQAETQQRVSMIAGRKYHKVTGSDRKVDRAWIGSAGLTVQRAPQAQLHRGAAPPCSACSIHRAKAHGTRTPCCLHLGPSFWTENLLSQICLDSRNKKYVGGR